MAHAPTHDTLDGIYNQIVTANNPAALAHTLRSNLPRHAREGVLAGLLGSGQDPLTLLDMRAHTLGYLYILSARLHSTSVLPPWQTVVDFCRLFVPEQARYAPERVTLLAKGITRLADHLNRPAWAIAPLYDLVTRYPPDPSYLTTVHPIFVLACVSTRRFAAALPVLAAPITSISTDLSDLSYNDNLVYHYAGGVALAALKRWGPAAELLEICATAPGSAPAAVQMEALKKLVLVQLIARGKTAPLPKYTHPVLVRLLKGSPYGALAGAYARGPAQLRALVEKERPLFASEQNLGLVLQALARAPRWAVKTLTATYLALGLRDIARAAGAAEADARALVLSMIEDGDIDARISADGTVTFADPPPHVAKADVERVLRAAQVQSAALAALEAETARSREYLSKAVRTRDEGAVWAGVEEEAYVPAGGAAWVEDGPFRD